MKQRHLYFLVPVVGALLVWLLVRDVGASIFVFIALLVPAFLRVYIPYAKDNPKHLWFKRKLYGWGWTPVTWQGWALTLLYVGLLFAFAFTIDETSSNSEVAFTFVLPAILLTVAFIRIAYARGEKPRWQWGPKNHNEQ